MKIIDGKDIRVLSPFHFGRRRADVPRTSCAPCGVLRSLSLKVRTQPFQGWGIGFKSNPAHSVNVSKGLMMRKECKW